MTVTATAGSTGSTSRPGRAESVVFSVVPNRTGRSWSGARSTRCRSAEGGDERVGQFCRVGAVGVEIGVEDADVDPGAVRSQEQWPQEGSQLLVVDAARIRTVHRRHDL